MARSCASACAGICAQKPSVERRHVVVAGARRLFEITECPVGDELVGFARAKLQQIAGNRAQFFRDVSAGPFYGFNREGVQMQEGVIQNWWRQGMMGSAKAHYDGIKAFSETDQTEDLRAILPNLSAGTPVYLY